MDIFLVIFLYIQIMNAPRCPEFSENGDMYNFLKL